MRKHFLILMLFALLPFAGWAASGDPISNYNAAFVDDEGNAAALVYNGSTQPFPAVKLVLKTGTDNTTDVTTNVTATNWTFNGKAVTQISHAGEYKCNVQCDDLTGTLTNVTLTVGRLPITITAKNINWNTTVDPAVVGDELTFGATKAAVEAKYELAFTGFPEDANHESVLGEDVEEALKAAFKAKITSYETDYDQWKDIPAVGYFTYLPIISALDAAYTDYTFTPIYGKIYLQARNLEAVDATVKTKEYDGTNYAPTYDAANVDAYNGLILKDSESNKTLRPGTDYTIAYYTKLKDDGTDVLSSTLVTDPANDTEKKLAGAGTYYAKITGKGNYATTATKIVPYQVTKKALAITTSGDEFTYSGLAQTINVDNYITFEGLINSDKNANGTPTTDAYIDATNNPIVVKLYQGTKVVGATEVVNAGEYKVVAAGKVNNSVSNIFKNYKVVYWNDGVIKVKKASLTFNIKNQAGELDGTHPLQAGVTPSGTNAATVAAVYFRYDGLMNGEETDDPKDYIDVYPTVKVGTTANEDGTFPIDFVYETKDGVTSVKGFKICVGTGTNKKDVTANYEIKVNPGKFTSNLITIGARPSNATIVYGDMSEKDVEKGVVPATITVSVGDGVVKEDKTAIEALLKKALVVNPEGKDLTNTEDVVYPAAGIYEVTLDMDKIDFSAYEDKYSITVFPGKLTINKKKLNITLKDQTLLTTENATNLVANGFTVEFDGVVYNDDFEDLYDAIETSGAFAFASTPAITLTAGETYEDEITLKTDNGVFANYTYTLGEDGSVTPGTLYVSDGGNVNILANSDYAETYYDNYASKTAEIVDIDAEKVNVTLKERTLRKQIWEPLVLPFNTSVTELVDALGQYAVVDILDETANDANIHFNLHMGDIPANTPFLIKVFRAVTLDNVTFQKKTIVAPAQQDENGNPYIADAAGHKYVGLYDLQKDLTGAGIWALNQNGIFKELGSKKTDLQATKAYLDLSTASTDARILIEEPDGQVTAISTISADVKTNAAEGWYTINGMKLNNMPTEKGIYILNGKKVVVK